MTLLAVEQFMPCLAIGALLTMCIYTSAQAGGLDVARVVVACI